LWFPDEKPIILATKDGFGKYKHDAIRARRLLYALECLRNPDEVYRPVRLQTADRAYIKEFDSTSLPYPFTVVLVRKEKSCLTLCTGQPVKRTDIKRWRVGDLLWPKTPRPSR
jgi:phage-Barnase-EndoU-ColicinE5/D-RelE like nuclease2